MGWTLSQYQQVVAGTLDTCDPLVCFPRGHPASVIYTTNAIESVNMTLRKVTRNHRIFPSDEAVYKVVYLAMRNLAKRWTMPIRDWKPALNRFAIECGERFPQPYSTPLLEKKREEAR